MREIRLFSSGPLKSNRKGNLTEIAPIRIVFGPELILRVTHFWLSQ